MTTKTKVSQKQATAVLASVAAWLGQKGYGGPNGEPAPTGEEAQRHGLGPMLVMDWDWSSEPTPTVILEGGPYDWALLFANDTHGGGSFDEEMYALGRAAGMTEVQARTAATGPAAILPEGVRVEPYAGYALCVYPA